MRIRPLSVDERSVLQEARPEAAPVEIALAPQLRLVQRLDVREVEGDLVQLPSRLELRPRRRAPLDLGVRVEQASLHLGPGPGSAHGLGEAAAAVGDHDVGRRYRLHERRPRPRVLGLRHVPRDRPILAAADQHDQAFREPDPVDEEDPVELAVGHRHGPDLPELRGPAPEGPASAGHLELRVLRQKPRQELVEAGGGVVVAHGGRCAAGGASTTVRPRGGSAVPLRRTAAVRAFDRLHGATSSDERFNVSEKGYPPGATTVARTHILSECLNRAHEFKQAKKRHRPAPMPLMRTHILSYKPMFMKRRDGSEYYPRYKKAQKSCRKPVLVMQAARLQPRAMDLPKQHAGNHLLDQKEACRTPNPANTLHPGQSRDYLIIDSI